jgi:hypothetical protein
MLQETIVRWQIRTTPAVLTASIPVEREDRASSCSRYQCGWRGPGALPAWDDTRGYGPLPGGWPGLRWLARSEAEPTRRSRPPSPTARASSRTRKSRSASAWAARSSSPMARPSSMSVSISASRRRYAAFACASSTTPASRPDERASPRSTLRRASPDPPFSTATRSSTWNSRPGSARRRARYRRPFRSRRRTVCPSNATDQ